MSILCISNIRYVITIANYYNWKCIFYAIYSNNARRAQLSVTKSSLIQGLIYTFSARGLGPGQGGWKICNANVAHNHSPPQVKYFEKFHVLLIKEDISVKRIE